jgi:AbrB family looped-hinge helix DNA binding protein
LERQESRTRVSAKGQVVIPKALRERLGIEKGLELTLTPLDENRLLLEKVPRLSQLFKFMGKARGTAMLLEERRAEARGEEARLSELFAS